MKDTDTIAAVATAPGSAGIGIVRVSGKEATAIADRIFVPAKKGASVRTTAPHTALYGHIADDNEIIDEAIVLVMKAPHSYTAEDTVEIDCHGGALVTRKILSAVIKHGARAAMPGEFTKRAFLNGRIDLSQAEAVMDVIQAQNRMALKSAISQLDGRLGAEIREIREKILYHIAFIEAALDDPEHLSLDGYRDNLKTEITKIKKRIKELSDSYENGRIIKEGIKTVILGKPNAGKSTILNLLAGEDKAIVTEIAGTTRDALSEDVNINGILFHFIDTAGIRDTDDSVEKIGVGRAKELALSGDLIFFVADATVPLDENDREIINIINGKKVVVLLNKSDCPAAVGKEELESVSGHRVFCISAKENTGFDAVFDEVSRMFFSGEIRANDEIIITNVRHREALDSAYESLELVEQAISKSVPEDFFSIDLTDAYRALGTILGERVEDDVADKIFSEFCVGK